MSLIRVVFPGSQGSGRSFVNCGGCVSLLGTVPGIGIVFWCKWICRGCLVFALGKTLHHDVFSEDGIVTVLPALQKGSSP